MRILVFADLHYFGDPIETALFNTKQKLVRFAEPLLEKLTALLQADDICINLGDIIQDTNDKQKDLDCLQYMFGKIKEMPCPCYSLLGNHDLKMMDTVKEVEDIVGHPSTFSMDVGGFHLVFFTTALRPELGLGRGGIFKTQYVSDETLLWLKKDLAANTLPALVFTHFGLAEDSTLEDECLFMKNRQAVKDILKKDKHLVAVFSGHQHRTKTHVEDGVIYYHLGSMTALGDTAGVPSGVYFELLLDDTNLTVTEKHIIL